MQAVNSCEKSNLPLAENQVRQMSSISQLWLQGLFKESLCRQISLIIELTLVGFSLYHLGHAFLDFTLILSESSALNQLLLSKTTYLTNYQCLAVGLIKMTQL